MKLIDTLLQKTRIRQASRFIRKGDSVLDIGSSDGVMFQYLKGVLSEGIGIDPLLEKELVAAHYRLIPGFFPEVAPRNKTFDVVTMLAVLEHIPIDSQKALVKACWEKLKPDGRVIITVPSPKVDHILAVLKTLRLIDGMSLEEHYGFKPDHTSRLFGPPYFREIYHSTFQFGLNNLFVFEKSHNQP